MGQSWERAVKAPDRNGHLPLAGRARVISIGTALPANRVENAQIEGFLDTSDEWIQSRTGIRERRVAEGDTTLLDLALRAARAALSAGGRAPAEVDTILCSSSSPDSTFPSLACRLQAALGCPPQAAFDIQAACSGAVYGLALATALIEAGMSRLVLLVNAEIFTRVVDWSDRSTAVLFGDGAGALLVGPAEGTGAEILLSTLGADGGGAWALNTVPAPELPPGAARPAYTASPRALDRVIQMNGREVFRFSTKILEQVVNGLVESAGITLDDLSLIVPHQANSRILATAAGRLGLPMERFASNVERMGNTSSASIPLALAEAARDGRCHEGELLCLVAFGAGLTWGGTLLRWQPTPVVIDDPAAGDVPLAAGGPVESGRSRDEEGGR